MENSTELVVPSPRDLATTLRKAHPELPEIWEGGPSKNPAAKAIAFRIGQDLKKGIDVSSSRLEWFHMYSKAMIRKRTTIIQEEESFDFDNDTSQDNKELTIYLLDAIIKSKREVIERTENLHKMYQELLEKKEAKFLEYVGKQEERRDDVAKATIELFAKDKDKNLDQWLKFFSTHSKSQQETINASNSQQASLFTSVTSILSSSHSLTEKYFNSLKEVIEKLEGGLLEDFVRIVLFPASPAIIAMLFKLLKVNPPDGLLEKVASAMKSALTDTQK